jgi:hypothetical protein
LPLILAALPENQSLFRRISHNPFLIPEGVSSYSDSMAIDTLRDRAWRVLEPHYLARLAGLVEMFGAAHSRELAADDLTQVAASATAGRVGTLLVEADRLVPGRIDHVSGEIAPADLAHPEVDDVLDDLAQVVMKNGGQVVIVPPERMPVRSGAAAILRY